MTVALRKSTLYLLLGLLVALEIGDVALTAVALAHGSYEANPFVARLMEHGGVFVLFVIKLMLLDVLVAIGLLFWRFWPRMTVGWLALACVAMAAVDARSVLMLMGV